jgi:hypothetical protein
MSQKKRYLGKKLSAPFNGPKTERVPNPEKEEIGRLSATARRELRRILAEVNDSEDLAEMLALVRQRLAAAKENALRPAFIEIARWTGSLVQELVDCGKEECKKCKQGPSHGPYWYHYTAQE